MSTDPTDLEQQLRATLGRTADRVTEAPRPALSWERPTAGGPVTVPAPRRRSRVRTAVRFAAPLAVAAAVAGVVVLPGHDQAGGVPAPSGTVGAPGTPTTVLQEVALLAPASTVPLQPGEFLYSRQTMHLDETTLVIEIWRPQHATDPWTRTTTYLDAATGEPSRNSVTGAAMPPETLTAPCGDFFDEVATCDDAGSMDDPTPQFLATLPTDPVELYQQLRTWAIDRDRQEMSELPGGEELLSLYEDENWLAQVTINGIIDFATATNGMSQPFSARLQQALATMPGAVAGHETNPAGEGTASYSATSVNSYGDEGTTNTLIFDADGNFVGTPYWEVVVRAAEQAGVAPALG